MAAVSVCVVGAGVCGLSTALLLAESKSIPYKVTIIADQFSPKTTSNAAAAVVAPFILGPETPIQLQRRWIKQTMDWLGSLYKTTDATTIGVILQHLYFCYDKMQQDSYWKDWLLSYRKLTPKEKEMAFADDSIIDGWCCSTFTLDTDKYMHWLTNKLKNLNCRFIQKKLRDLSEVSSYDIVVNCSGIGANRLVPDPSVVPVRGQAIRVKAPWVQHCCIYINEKAISYILPRATTVLLGGTAQAGNWSKSIDPNDSKRIFEDCCKIIPSLKNAETVEEIVDLRPSRPSVRLEIETRRTGHKDMKIVHNYGHGGSGISLHWGCALDSFKLVEKLAEDIRVSCKL
ncbi:D-amino-acid oxidase [Trichoplax sp. H2]|nr:D-amino-acid oxidase [Trichoplax sp. H2]|eukprot:RDD41250.1 D-amino-acid oxidase [Trichoplax sp. H2]